MARCEDPSPKYDAYEFDGTKFPLTTGGPLADGDFYWTQYYDPAVGGGGQLAPGPLRHAHAGARHAEERPVELGMEESAGRVVLIDAPRRLTREVPMALRKPSPKPPAASGESNPGNPYVDWAWGPGKPYYFPPGLQDEKDQRMTLLVQLQGMSAEQFVQGRLLPQERAAAAGLAELVRHPVPRRARSRWRPTSSSPG